MANIFNPFRFTSRTFTSFLQDINNDSELIDKPNWWKRGIAGIGDVFSLMVNAEANNAVLSTSFTRRRTQQLLDLIDYQMAPLQTASGNIIFYISDSASFPFNIDVSDLVALTPGTTAISSKRFEARASVNVILVSENFLPGAVDDSTNIITVTREFATGEKIRFSSTGTLPSPLSDSTSYYVIKSSATEIKIASSIANAYSGIEIDITDQGTGTHTIELYSVQVLCYQQQLKDSSSIGSSDGTTAWQEFDLLDVDILKDTVLITIDSVDWQNVDTFVESGPTDKHYRIYFNDDNSAKIQFGNGVYGQIPGAFDIFAQYATGGGSDSNITTQNRINIYGGTDSNITGVSNSSTLTGGANEQSTSEAKILGPLLLKARNRFVTAEDGEALAESFSGISQAKVIGNAFGVLSAKVICIANGGGNPSASVQSDLQTFLIDRSILETPDIRVLDTTITAQNVTSAAKLLPGYVWSGQVENYFRMGWKLFFSEAGKQIKNIYDSEGVDSARELINVIFTENFTLDDNFQIRLFLEAWNNEQISFRTIGEGSIEGSDAFAFIATFTTGVDNITISSPVFPISIADDEITTYGSLSLTEI